MGSPSSATPLANRVGRVRENFAARASSGGRSPDPDRDSLERTGYAIRLSSVHASLRCGWWSLPCSDALQPLAPFVVLVVTVKTCGHRDNSSDDPNPPLPL